MSDHLSFDAYTDALRSIRYRGGAIDGYPSRLHYFTDWIYDNQRKEIVRDLTKAFGGVRYIKHIDFMTRHRSLYPKLTADSNFAALKAAEDSINHCALFYIPKSRIQNLGSEIHNGDIIAVATSVQGLDVSHVGIAIRLDDGSLHLLHAPDVGEKVTITKATLVQSLATHRSEIGIMVARPSK